MKKVSLQQRASATLRNGKTATFAVYNAIHYNDLAAVTPCVATVIFLVEFLQMLSFPLLEVFSFPWHNGYTSWLQSLSRIARLDVLISGENLTAEVPVAAFVIVAVFTVLWLMDVIVCAVLLRHQSHPDHQTQDQPQAALDVTGPHMTLGQLQATARREFLTSSLSLWSLRVFGNFASTVGFIPMVGILLMPLRCKLGGTCRHKSADNVILAVVGVGCALLFVLLAFASVAFYVHRKTASVSKYSVFDRLKDKTANEATNTRSAYSRSHSRFEILYLFIRLVLVVIFTVTFVDSSNVRWALCIVFAIASTILAVAFTAFLPYHNQAICGLRVILGWLLMLAALCLMLTILYNDDAQPLSAMMLFLGAPFIGALALFTVSWRRQTLVMLDDNAVLAQGEFAVEVKCRLYLDSLRAQAAATPKIKRKDAAPDPSPSSTTDHRRTDLSTEPLSDTSNLRLRPFGGGGAKASIENDVTIGAESDFALQVGLEASRSEYGRCLDKIEELMQETCHKNAGSSLACLQLARFYWDFRHNEQLYTQMLTEANKRRPGIDADFLLNCYQSDVEALYVESDAETIGSLRRLDKSVQCDNTEATITGTDIAIYMQYQEHLARATALTEIATQRQHQFWSELLLPEPEVQKLLRIGTVGLQLGFSLCLQIYKLALTTLALVSRS